MLKKSDSHNMTTGHDFLITAQASVSVWSCLMLHSQILQDESDEFPNVNPISQEEFSVGNSPWGISHVELTRESPWRIHHDEFTMRNSPWIWFPGHSSWISQFSWGKESDSPRGIPRGEFSYGEFMWIFPVNSPQVSNGQYCSWTIDKMCGFPEGYIYALKNLIKFKMADLPSSLTLLSVYMYVHGR